MEMKKTNIGIFFAMAILIAACAPAQVPPTPSEREDFTVEVIVPSTMQTGHQPFELLVKITNTTEKSLSFSSEIYLGGPAWGKENHGYERSDSTVVSGVHCGGQQFPDACSFRWEGTIPAGETVVFTLPTFSGDIIGTAYDAVKVTVVVHEIGKYDVTRNITLVETPVP